MPNDLLTSVPIELPILKVLPEWLDQNGHMNIAFYLRAFDTGCDPAFEAMGLGWSYTAQGEGTTFTLESRLAFLREVFEGDPLRLTVQILDVDQKRLHFFVRMYQAEAGYLAATHESLITHASVVARRTTPFPPAVYESLRGLLERHRALPRPEGLERPVGIRR